MIIRSISVDDYNKGYFELLEQLTKCSKPDYVDWYSFITYLNSYHIIMVIEDNNKIIATGTLLVEKKIIHNMGLVGHIEDIVIDKNYRGSGLGKQMVKYLMDLSEDKGCYKTILNCTQKNTLFYVACGLEEKGVQMVKYNE